MQPIGALLANVVAVGVVLYLRRDIDPTIMFTECTGQCARSVDLMWRWIVGIGAIPPFFAILLRWWIPESPRYTLEVEMNPTQAAKDVKIYYDTAMSPIPRPSETTVDPRFDPDTIAVNFSPNTETTLAFGEPMMLKELRLTEPAIAVTDASSDTRVLRKESWSEWWRGLWKYLYEDGNWTDLAGTSVTWPASGRRA